MRQDAVTLLGLIAGTLTTAAFLPQVLKTWRSRAARDVSLAMFVILGLGVGLWVVYGTLIGSAPVLIANGVTLVLVLVMLALKWRFRGSDRSACTGPRANDAASSPSLRRGSRR